MGRPITVRYLRSARNVIREHLQWHGKTIVHDLSAMLGVSPKYAGTLMRRKRCAIVPEHIEAFIKAMKLDEFDANELRLYGARDAGWNIDIDKVRGFDAPRRSRHVLGRHTASQGEQVQREADTT